MNKGLLTLWSDLAFGTVYHSPEYLKAFREQKYIDNLLEGELQQFFQRFYGNCTVGGGEGHLIAGIGMTED